MKLKFEDQDFQTQAVNAVADLFAGQDRSQDLFAVSDNILAEFGTANHQLIDDETLNNNLNTVQKRFHLPLTQDAAKHQFSIEMEVGTGKTLTYTRTIFELNKRYGFTKFIIVVPSRAIREGVYKSLEITSDYIKNKYNNEPFHFFIYNADKLSEVRQFALSSAIEIMIINIDAFNKDKNVINQEYDRLSGRKTIEYIQDVRPIVILDEPQSIDNTDKAKEAIASLNPLCVLRYSATHREKINLLYRLTPVDAYQLGLVKQIAVASNSIANDYNTPFIALKSVSSENGFKAKLEIDVQNTAGAVTRKILTVKPGSDLFLLSGHRDLYDGYIVSAIDCTPGFERVEFSTSESVELGKSIGGVDERILKRAQIYRTIETHLNKELMLHSKGIKVLSLFFIDEVKRYRTPDGDKGLYAQMFEECYNELMAKPKYAQLKEWFDTSVEKAHNGYFSQDKKGAYKNTNGDTQTDDDTYNTIMKAKEWLLSFECPLRFIFSHSALKEGWDNPNVFQVCTLLEQKSVFTRRQKLGRGMRLCVNQNGERIKDKNINILHVMADESFADFADKLQKEIENETGLKFGVLEMGHLLAMTWQEEKQVSRTFTLQQAKDTLALLQTSGVINQAGEVISSDKLQEETSLPQPVKTEVLKLIQSEPSVSVQALEKISYMETVVEEKTLTNRQAEEVLQVLKEKKVISKEGTINQSMKEQLANGVLDLDERWSRAKQRAIIQAIEKADAKPVLRDASKEVMVRMKKQVLESPEFNELWNKIKQKTVYRVQIDTEKLVADCVQDLKAMPPMPKARLVTSTGKLDIKQNAVETQAQSEQVTDLQQSHSQLPDILRLISTETLLKRTTIARIIKESGRAEDFLINPQAFYERALAIILSRRHALAIDGIRYIKLAGSEYYAVDVFDRKELLATLDKNAVAVDHGVYDYVLYDSQTERDFAVSLDRDPEVKMFFKIPSSFTINTPIGNYNPDWAVFWEKNGEHKLYFVLESKGSERMDDLRPAERQKIHCGAKHFEALGGVHLPEQPIKSWTDFKVKHTQ